MAQYLNAYLHATEQITRNLLNGRNLSDQQIKDNAKRLCIVCAFLNDNPQLLSWRGNNRPSLTTQQGIEAIGQKFFGARFKTNYPAEPQTSPDEVVSLVMQLVYGYTANQTLEIKQSHLRSMSSENIVGALLERYIASVMETHDWVWCAGDFVKAVDFLHFQNGNWTALQIKNRDNTENSSSSAIRNGTEIQKWFRSFSRTGETNWNNFPDAEFRNKLSENGFQDFIRAYLRAATP